MKGILRHIMLLMFSFAAFCTMAQSVSDNLTWRMNVKMADNGEGEVIIKCIPGEGWHFYGFDMPEGGPKPTSIDLSGSIDVEFVSPLRFSPAMIEDVDQMFQRKLKWWDTTTTFRRKFKVTGANPKIVAKIQYMGCNNKTCLPPQKKELSRVVKVKN